MLDNVKPIVSAPDPFLGLSVPEWQALGTFLAVLVALTSPFVMHALEVWRKKQADERSAGAALVAIAWDLQELRTLMKHLISYSDANPEEFKKVSKYLVESTPQASSEVGLEAPDAKITLIEKLDDQFSIAFANCLGNKGKVLKALQGYWDLYEGMENIQEESLRKTIIERAEQCASEIDFIMRDIPWEAYREVVNDPSSCSNIKDEKA
ncbi:hypothetical protein [Halospina sp. K52047b]|uniref:hypothetical protein n=1 Tax=Halospina sp. K52047b TaxID=2614160 RepID=UPI00124A4918|nr:hypothetical protein [Halospina sp. K52047b]KAA8985179.1 hypothetical protein F3089_00355 [Halospina sp. K52047b]